MRRLLCLGALLLASCSTGISASPVVHRVQATPDETGRASVSVSLPTPAKVASHVVRGGIIAAPVPHKAVRPRPVAPRSADLAAFRHLGTWIDVFDYTNDPSTIRPLVAQMSKVGTKTLYLETARANSSTDIAFPRSLGIALDEAKDRGMRVVAWYPPAFDDMNRDLRRSIAAVKFHSPHGRRFDGFAADIEYTNGVPDAAERSKRAIIYSRELRSAVGKTFALGAIVIPPTSLQMNKQRWPNFPWSGLSPSYDLFMPMNYWTAHGKDAATAARLTRQNTQQTHALTGKPVHIIGGLGQDSDPSQVRAYVDAARAAGSLGGGLYDFKTTKSNVWSELRRFN